jgi:hypothetical protein
MDAIRRIYASSLNPDALQYRRNNQLLDYDERMAILLQRATGEQHGRYFFPSISGVAFSQNPFRWHPKIRREDGFLRIVWGIGTRAVDRVDRDYPRLVALSHPQLRPETTAKAIRQYSQWYVDVIDLAENSFKTLPVLEVLKPDYPYLRYIASLDKDDYLQNIVSLGAIDDSDRLVLTFDPLLKDPKFIDLMRTTLSRLEAGYKTPVDTEFTIEILPNYPYTEYKLHLLQCRPLSQRSENGQVEIPRDIPAGDILFTARELVPDGKVENIRYIIFVDPEKYRLIPDQATKLEIGRAIGRLNKRLENDSFVLLGPGRWGSANIDLGVRVSYADIYNTRVLIEVAVAQDGVAPELSYGTHFFQDLVESGIYSLPLHLNKEGNSFNWAFFHNSPNCLATLSPEDATLADYLQVIDIAAVTNNCRLVILMDGSSDEAIGYLTQGNWPSPNQQGSVSSF